MAITIIDLIPNYIRCLNGQDSIDSYIESYPAFFKHYFDFWGRDNIISLMLNETKAYSRGQMLRRCLKEAEVNFSNHNLNLNNLFVVIFVGQHKANGHAFIDGQNAIAWFAIETLETEEQMRVFVTHELVHALQYSTNPQSYFNNAKEKTLVSRQLVTEGIATYLTTQLSSINEEKSLWADTLLPYELERWMEQCRADEFNLFNYVLTHFDSSDEGSSLFLASDSSNIYHYRAGYYVGLKVIEYISLKDNLAPHDLIELTMLELVEKARLSLIVLRDTNISNKH